MSRQRHTIGRAVLNLTFESEATAKSVQQELPGLINNGFQSSLDNLFNRFFPANETVIVSRLEVQLGKLDAGLFEGQFKEKLVEGIKAELIRLSSEHRVSVDLAESPGELKLRRISDDAAWLEVFNHYLLHGTLPWWSEILPNEVLESRIIALAGKNRESLLALIRQAMAYPSARKRLVFQFTDRFNLQLIKELYPDQLSGISMINHILPEIFHKTEDLGNRYTIEDLKLMTMIHLWMHLVRSEGTTNPGYYALATVLSMADETKCSPANMLKKIPARLLPEHYDTGQDIDRLQLDRFPENFIRDSEKPQEYYVENAGLVLLWPFLEKFLTQVGLVADGKFIDGTAHERALVILHFLASGTQIFEEHQFFLIKILSGWPVDQPFKKQLKLVDQEKLECSALLQAVIENWSVLKGTSIQGFRETFLLRNGIITRKDEGWMLRAEQKGIDILMDQLPWTFSTIRLPWMDEILFVEW